jgi:PBP1b-binding outer membrane lipoprotein LpoB
MFKIILTVITLALIFTSCNHNQRNRNNYHFEQKPPDIGLDVDNDLIINPPITKIPEPSFLFVTIKLNQLQK